MHPGSLAQDLDIGAVEYYAGKHEVSKAQWDAGVAAYPMDLRFDETTMDVNTPLGAPKQ